MDDYEIISQQRIGDFVLKYDTEVSKAIAQLNSERVFINSTDVIVDRYQSTYHVCVMVDYTLPNIDMKRICETLEGTYWAVTSSIHISGYQIMIWDKEIHKYFDK